MSFHHHHSVSHHHNTQHFSCCCNSNSTCCYSNSKSNCCCSSKSTPQLSSDSSQQLLETLTSLLLIQPQQPQQNYRKPLHTNHNYYHPPQPKINNNNHDSLLHSLIRRVSALESSLSSLSRTENSPSHSHSYSNNKKKNSIKQLAAITIQRHFRSYLVRRSRTLGDLKQLAVIKSNVAGLRSCLASDKSLKNPHEVSKEAVELLYKLDSIQSSDVMIREGKRSIGKELVRISEFVDKVLLREQKDEIDELEKRRDRVRRVSFEENTTREKYFDDLSESISEEEETHLRNLGFYNQLSDSDESPKVMHGGLAAPMPVKMESRRNGFTKKAAIEDD